MTLTSETKQKAKIPKDDQKKAPFGRKLNTKVSPNLLVVFFFSLIHYEEHKGHT